MSHTPGFFSTVLLSKILLPAVAVAGWSLAAVPASASTIFITNNTTPKTLASNEGDAGTGLTTGGTDNGNNNGLDQDRAGDSTVLALSADDGGGPITFSTSDVSGNNKLQMDGDSMGHGNDKWGNGQNWTFSMDLDITFDALTFKTMNENNFILQSTAWANDTIDDSGQEWSFTTDGTVGTFEMLGQANGAGTYDFTDSGASVVTAGTAITMGYLGGANGGEELSSFTITPSAVVIPEPASLALLGLGGLCLIGGRRRRA